MKFASDSPGFSYDELTLKDVPIPFEKGFYKTDLQFGSGNEKNPILLVSPQTKEELISEKFIGITFQEVNL
ncbi:hypothetical protein [Leptospira santarosai]|uniref:hypothetical protein n=1 Tax=Leptospira santarosai TaxID=28183 RepID=UPI0002984E30|nr:hypothetical protein [Leptospira santarosai]EKS06491.1 hypothetical protein LEP1GSC071_1430 [Leptospira santarosai str. JET]MDI7204655.1 hypothetical protein [Leptospira santarosai]